MITIPAMPSQYGTCPALELTDDPGVLRTIAHALTKYVDSGSRYPICTSVESVIQDLKDDELIKPTLLRPAAYGFMKAVGNALGDAPFITWFLVPCKEDRLQARAVRPIWAAHIARSIYEQIGA